MRLTRIAGDPALYGLDGVGTLCVIGRNWRAATVEARGLSWTITCRRSWQPVIQIADPVGNVVGTVKGRRLRHSRSFAWSARRLTLRSDSRSPAYILITGNRVLAKIEPMSRGERSPTITVDEQAAIEPELLLFTAFVMGKLAPKRRGGSHPPTPAVDLSHGPRPHLA